jgi:hypothetical protein
LISSFVLGVRGSTGVVGPDFSKEGKDATDLRDVGAGTGFFICCNSVGKSLRSVVVDLLTEEAWKASCRWDGEAMGGGMGEEFGCVPGCQRSSTELFRPPFAGRDLSDGEGPDCCSN